MAIEKSVVSPRKGMNRDVLPSELSKEEYPFALNANIQDEHGNGLIIIQNESSNIKCTGFKTGYKVVGKKYVQNKDMILFLLTNPTTGFSEIGYVDSISSTSGLTPVEQIVNGQIQVVIEDALENTVQTSMCTYTTLVSDECLTGSQLGSKCLNFSVNDPFHDDNLQIKYGKRGTTFWFIHDRNPPRYINLDELISYTQDVDPCTGVVSDICLDCEKMRIFPLVDIPCLQPKVIKNGGKLRLGVNEILIAYSDSLGNELTNCYAITNPIPIFDKNNLILDQTLLDSFSGQAINIDILGLDDKYEYYKIFVIHRSGLDSAVTVYEYGVYSVGQSNITIHNLEDKIDVDMSKVIARRPFYQTAKGMGVSGGYAYLHGLTTQREINLQPVVNLMGSLARWNTYQALETLYEDGVAIANYGSAMRDEVYPNGIVFEMLGGHETALFPFIARPPKAYELQVLGTPEFPVNDETNSVLDYNPECAGNDRVKRWQFENTAEELDVCTTEGLNVGQEIVNREVVKSCYVKNEGGFELTVVDTIASSELIVSTDADLITYINTHRDEIILGTTANGADIRDILEDPTDYPQNCVPNFDDSCGVPTLQSEQVFPIAVETQTTAVVDKPLEDYEKATQNTGTCGIYTTSGTGGTEQDTAFVSAYMLPAESVIKKIVPANSVCAAAVVPATFSVPQFDNTNHLIDKGSITTTTTLVTTTTIDGTYSKMVITLTGTSGTANVNIGGTNYPATFATDLTTTAANFVILYAVSILTATGLVLTSVGETLVLEGDYAGFLETPVVNATGTLAGTYDNSSFTDKLHSNAVWYKIDFGGSDKKVFEVGTTLCVEQEDNSSKLLRITAFSACGAPNNTAGYSSIIKDMSSTADAAKLLLLEAADFGGPTSSVYIALDSPIRTRVISPNVVNTLTPPCGCFSVFRREAETSIKITYTNLTFGKKQTYVSMCSFSIPKLNGCEAVPFKKGLFSYVESTERYPCNDEMFNSSGLVIEESDIPAAYRTEFESYYVSSVVGSTYVLDPVATDFKDKPIRHYKYPDNNVAPFMSSEQEDPGSFNKSVIYPIGFNISAEVIAAFLDIAVKNGLLTEEERSRIISYKIFRGDRRTQKSVIAKGILFDMYKYTDGDDNVFYPNYPLNTLGTDQLNGAVAHPFESTKNNFFTFHSPDTELYNPSLPYEMSVEGYLFGSAANYFDEVRNHPTYVLLGSDSYSLATTLAVTEVVFETILQASTWVVNAGAGGVSAIAAAILAALAIIAMVVAGTFRSGEYRYRWIETLTNLGKPTNFAYYQACVGYYNVFKKNTVPAQKLRGLTLSSYINSGMLSLSSERGDTLNYPINNLDRENSVALHTGDYPVVYTDDYVSHDNYDLTPALASRSSYTSTGKSGRYTDNVASPYASIKDYNPSQYGTIESIDWINTGFCGSLQSSSDCDAAFGGDVFISRFSLKRKLPFFRTNAFGLAPLTPFKYSDYFNINPEETLSRYFIDYEINDDGSNYISMFVFPSNKSKYNLDNSGDDIGGYYVKLPNKFYLFSYGIPHFLVESVINCNFRYAKRERHEDFYPHISDVTEWTQEENVSIRKDNEFFYNTVYSAEHSYYPHRMLPSNYSKSLFDKLNDLENTTIYSAQDVSENSAADPWLHYRALDLYTFSKSMGTLVSLIGIESSQILARFTNGYTIFGAIDQIRDRLTEDTANLGNGGIFAGRPINFNITELGYAGTQHNTLVSCKYGHFWPDAKRGKVFQLTPNAEANMEISGGGKDLNPGLEKWFKENLPFKILNYFPNCDVDNLLNGIGLTMAWDERLERVFLTKRDYIPLDPNILYTEGEGFYIEGALEDCPAGYTDLGASCQLLEYADKDITTDPIIVSPATSTAYGWRKPLLFSQYLPDGSGLVDGLSPTGYTFQYLNDPFWTGNGVVLDRIVNRLGRWNAALPINVWYGTSVIIDVPTTKIYYVALAADNKFRFSVNGTVIITSDNSTIAAMIGTSVVDQVSFNSIFIYPIELEAGCHSITIEGYNEDMQGSVPSPGMFAAAIFDNTESELVAVTTDADINYIISTETMTNFYSVATSIGCPDGYIEEGPGLCDRCVKETIVIKEKPHIPAELTNPKYFNECSFTVAYSPKYGGWISYYSFLPNYYVGLNDHFRTGINNSTDPTEIGLWNHLYNQSSYQVFYGKLSPFIIEFPVISKLVNSRLEDIHYWLDVKKYYNKYDFADVYGIGFNKAVVYNNYQNTGMLNLVHRKDDDIYQDIEYPKFNADSVDILQTEINNRWAFNYLYNAVINERSGLPVWREDCAQINKYLDIRLLDFENVYKDYMRGDNFLVRLINDKESRYKFLFRWAEERQNFYEQ